MDEQFGTQLTVPHLLSKFLWQTGLNTENKNCVCLLAFFFLFLTYLKICLHCRHGRVEESFCLLATVDIGKPLSLLLLFFLTKICIFLFFYKKSFATFLCKIFFSSIILIVELLCVGEILWNIFYSRRNRVLPNYAAYFS